MARRPCALVVDSGAVLPAVIPVGTAVVPLRIAFGAEILRDGVDIDADTFYARLATGQEPTTSTPSAGDYLEAFRSAEAEEIVCLTIARSLSAMYQTAMLAARLLVEGGDPRPVHVVDTESAAAGFGLIVRAAAALTASGASASAVLDRVTTGRGAVRMYGSLTTLRHLARSGRVPGIAAGVGDLLGVRPVFELRAGAARRIALLRGESRVLRCLTRLAEEHGQGLGPQWLLVFHSGVPGVARALHGSIQKTASIGRSEICALSPVVGAYTGPGMIGFAALPLQGVELDPVS